MRFSRTRLLGGSVLSVVGVAAAIVGVSSPAMAASSSCATHYFCVWTDGGFTGTQWSGSGYTSYINVPSYEHDAGSSWANHNASQRECAIDHVNGAQVYLDVVNAGVNRGVVPSGTNDKIDAIGFC